MAQRGRAISTRKGSLPSWQEADPAAQFRGGGRAPTQKVDVWAELKSANALPRPAPRPESQAPKRPQSTRLQQAQQMVNRPDAVRPGSAYPAAQQQEVRRAPERPTAVTAARRSVSEPEAPGPGLRAWQRPENETVLEARHTSKRSFTRELSAEEYAALNPRQQAAVQFNAGLLAASNTDAKGSDDDAAREFLGRLGLGGKSEEDMNSFLRLDQLIGDSVLAKLGEGRTARVDAVSGAPQRTAEGGTAGQVADKAAIALAETLRTSGARGFTDTGERAGFGAQPRDLTIQRAYSYMVNPAYTMTPQEIADGLAQMNAATGTDVTPQELWDFARSQVDAADLERAAGQGGTLAGVLDPDTNEMFTPIDIAEIRRRYGI